jgi:hypothetical protein
MHLCAVLDATAYGASWGAIGMGCWYLLSALLMFPGMEQTTWYSLESHLSFMPTEVQSRPVNGDLVVFLECHFEVIEIGYAHYFDAKVVADEAKGDGPPQVRPQSWCVLALIVPLGR